MTSAFGNEARYAIRSLQIRNYRLWFIGQGVSMIGFWSQAVAQAILVLELTGSGSILGLVTALRFFPILIVGPWAGLLSDRMDKRRLLFITQSAMMLFTLMLGILVLSDLATVTWVITLAVLTGTAWSFDQPIRRTIVTELVADEDIQNAVSLNSAMIQSAKMIGPMIAGIIIVVWGIGWCFILNGVSFIAVLIALKRIDRSQMIRSVKVKRGSGQIRAGFVYVWSAPGLRYPMAALGLVGALSFNWNVLIPLFALRDLNGGAATFTIVMGSMSAGAIVGGLWLARLRNTDLGLLGTSCLLFGIALTLMALSQTVVLAAVFGSMMGLFSAIFINATVSLVQIRSVDSMRGRVMSVFSMVWLGSLGVGAPVAGWTAEHLTTRWAMGFSAIAAIAVGLVMKILLSISPGLREPEGASMNAPSAA